MKDQTFPTLAKNILGAAAAAVNPGTDVELQNQSIEARFPRWKQDLRLGGLPRYANLLGKISMSGKAPMGGPILSQEEATALLADALQAFVGPEAYPDRQINGFKWANTVMLNIGGDGKAVAYLSVKGAVSVFGPT